MTDPRHDIVLFGATSFVGRILARYFVQRHPPGEGTLHWALAGRSAARLDALRASLGSAAGSIPCVVADADDSASLDTLCAATRVVVSTVGPYALYGEPLVRACAVSGTDYCDLTGEVQWMRRMIERYEEQAQRSGARLVHCCGFDSIPFDLGVWMMQQEARRRFGTPLRRMKTRVRAARGGFSGGTIASLLNLSREIAADPRLRRELADPYSLCPDGHPFTTRQHQVNGAEFDADFDAWSGPFIMAPVNTRVVHRSNALSDASYGKDFRYDEAVLTGRGWRGRVSAMGLSAALAGFMLGTALGPSRAVLQRMLPSPGEGPSQEAQEHGFYDLRLFGETADGESLRGKVTGDADPGYGSTARMLGEAAACLALDVPDDAPGGFWTPATLLGAPLLDRLTQHAGMGFEVLVE